MPKAGTHTVRGNQNLTQYDSIKDTVGNKPTNRHRGAARGVTSALKEGDTVRASRSGSGGKGTSSPSLPKATRDYEAPQS